MLLFTNRPPSFGAPPPRSLPPEYELRLDSAGPTLPKPSRAIAIVRSIGLAITVVANELIVLYSICSVRTPMLVGTMSLMDTVGTRSALEMRSSSLLLLRNSQRGSMAFPRAQIIKDTRQRQPH